MAVLVNNDTKVICQGFTGAQGTFHSEQAIAYGTKMVGGVTPGKGGAQASRPAGVRHGARMRSRRPAPPRASIYVPPPFAADAILEAIDAGIPLVDLHHRGHSGARHGAGEARARRHRRRGSSARTAPASSRRANARSASCRATSTRKGQVGIVSRSGTLTYEAVAQTTAAGLGQSTCIGIGGDPVNGTNFIDVPRDVPRRRRDQKHHDDRRDRRRRGRGRGGFPERTPRSKSRWSASSPAPPRRRAAAWAMPAPSSPAAAAPPSTRSRR